MNKEDLMRYAKSVLGVEVRQAGPDGKKNRYRSVDDVKKATLILFEPIVVLGISAYLPLILLLR